MLNLNRNRKLVFLAASTILLSNSVLAFEDANVLTNIKGEVLVNQGESYVTALDGMHLNPGDQLMVMDGGQATIEFADGCLYNVNGNEVLRINTQSTCAVNASKTVGPYYAQLSTQPQQSNADKLVWGGAGLVGACLYYCPDDKKTISP